MNVEKEKLKKRIAEERGSKESSKKRPKVDSNKDMKLASTINNSNSCGSNSEHDMQIENLTPNVVNNRNRFPQKKTPTLKKSILKCNLPFLILKTKTSFQLFILT